MTLAAPRAARNIAGASVDLDALFHGRLDPSPSPRFEEAWARYQDRVPKPDGWWDEIEAHATGVRWASVPLVFALPTRNRTSTSRTVEALRGACEGARFVVFHNFLDAAPQEVAADLESLREAHDVLLIERAVDRSWTIGAIRAYAVDLCLRLGCPLIASADSDIVGFLDSETYARVVERFEDGRVDVTTHRRYVDLEGLVPDVNLLMLGIIDNLRAHVRSFEMRAVANVVGAAAVFRATSLCNVGGIPPVAVGEDLLMQDAFHRLRGRADSSVTIQENGVFVDHRAQYLDEQHYEGWAEDSVHATPTVPRNDTPRADAEGFIRAAVAGIYLDAIALAEDKARLMGESTEATMRFARLAQALPGMSLPRRGEVARAAMENPRVVPTC